MHLVFYDGQCGLCDRTVQLLLKLDQKKQFMFAPLQGTTAEKMLKSLPEKYKKEDSLILIENYDTDNPTTYLLGKGVLRIFWLLGGAWSLLGWISFLPAFLYNWIYRIVARNRHHFFQSACILPSGDKSRFLP